MGSVHSQRSACPARASECSGATLPCRAVVASAPAVWLWICLPGLQSCLPVSAWSLFPWGSIPLPTGSTPFPGFLPKRPESFSPTCATSCALLKQRVCDSQGARQGLWSSWGRGEGEVWGEMSLRAARRKSRGRDLERELLEARGGSLSWGHLRYILSKPLSPTQWRRAVLEEAPFLAGCGP